MNNELQGNLNAKDLKIAVVVARFNEVITEKLLEGALDTLKAHGSDSPVVVRVPGALELPVAADRLAKTKKLNAVICLGAVIRGENPHFDQVVNGTTAGLVRVSLDHGIPVIYGVLTTDTVDQALNRSGLKSGNKGRDVAVTAIEMANLLPLIDRI